MHTYCDVLTNESLGPSNSACAFGGLVQPYGKIYESFSNVGGPRGPTIYRQKRIPAGGRLSQTSAWGLAMRALPFLHITAA